MMQHAHAVDKVEVAQIRHVRNVQDGGTAESDGGEAVVGCTGLRNAAGRVGEVQMHDFHCKVAVAKRQRVHDGGVACAATGHQNSELVLNIGTSLDKLFLPAVDKVVDGRWCVVGVGHYAAVFVFGVAGRVGQLEILFVHLFHVDALLRGRRLPHPVFIASNLCRALKRPTQRQKPGGGNAQGQAQHQTSDRRTHPLALVAFRVVVVSMLAATDWLRGGLCAHHSGLRAPGPAAVPVCGGSGGSVPAQGRVAGVGWMCRWRHGGFDASVPVQCVAAVARVRGQHGSVCDEQSTGPGLFLHHNAVGAQGEAHPGQRHVPSSLLPVHDVCTGALWGSDGAVRCAGRIFLRSVDVSGCCGRADLHAASQPGGRSRVGGSPSTTRAGGGSARPHCGCGAGLAVCAAAARAARLAAAVGSGPLCVGLAAGAADAAHHGVCRRTGCGHGANVLRSRGHFGQRAAGAVQGANCAQGARCGARICPARAAAGGLWLPTAPGPDSGGGLCIHGAHSAQPRLSRGGVAAQDPPGHAGPCLCAAAGHHTNHVAAGGGGGRVPGRPSV
eukprot:m.118799 g.118799  ORF g.118799 m.118799 type:complete len:556 (+) comp19522_c0_seq3:980-2647(+)